MTFEQKWLELCNYYKKRVLIASRDPGIYRGDIYGFFTMCYHLKDHIKSDEKCLHKLLPFAIDPSLDRKNPIGDFVERFVQAQRCLLICGSVVTRYKHNENDKYVKRTNCDAFWVESNTLRPVRMRPVGLMICVELEPASDNDRHLNNQQNATRFEIQCDNGDICDAVNLAYDCLGAWSSFIFMHNLIPIPPV
jgi:hypothetical protein